MFKLQIYFRSMQLYIQSDIGLTPANPSLLMKNDLECSTCE